MDNKKMMLLYGFTEVELDIMKDLIERDHLPKYKIIETSMGQMKVGDIIDGMKFEILDNSMPQEKIILLNNFEEKELYDTVSLIRKSFKPAPILAVVTEVSVQWSFKELLEHLIEERNWAMKNRK